MYRRSIFTFIDILGFRQIAEKGKPEDIKRLLETLQREARPDDEISDELEMSFLTFSDSTVRAVPLDSKSNEDDPGGILWQELLSLVFLQSRMVRQGFFIRGGLTIDNIYIDGGTVFGPAIVKAYSLESEFAIYPRIVIDPEVFTLFENEPLLRFHDADAEWEYLDKLVRRDSDGLYFVDYLFGILSEFDDEGMEFDYLQLHKEVVLKSATNHKGLTKIAAKYLWLANYHNTVIGEISAKAYSHYGFDQKDFFITKDEFPLLYEHE